MMFVGATMMFVVYEKKSGRILAINRTKNQAVNIAAALELYGKRPSWIAPQNEGDYVGRKVG
jgi:hypothetical protein